MRLLIGYKVIGKRLMMYKSKMTRLDLILNKVYDGAIVCDVGSDHGITAIRVLEEKKPKKVIASDISAKSLQKLKDKISAKAYPIETLVCDGIVELEQFEPQIIIISGMGGFLIADILDRGFELAKKVDRFILQANNGLSHLRYYLASHGFEIIDEDIACEDEIFYDIIVASYTGNAWTYKDTWEYEYGSISSKKELPFFRAKLEKRVEEINYILNLIGVSSSDKTNKRRKELEEEERKIRGILGCL